MPTACAGSVWTRAQGDGAHHRRDLVADPRPGTPALVAGGDQNSPGDGETIRAGDHTSLARRPEPRRWAPGATHIPAPQAEDRPGRCNALFLPAWSGWPLTATAGRCVLAVVLPTFEDHEVTHQAVDAGAGPRPPAAGLWSRPPPRRRRVCRRAATTNAHPATTRPPLSQMVDQDVGVGHSTHSELPATCRVEAGPRPNPVLSRG